MHIKKELWIVHTGRSSGKWQFSKSCCSWLNEVGGDTIVLLCNCFPQYNYDRAQISDDTMYVHGYYVYEKYK
jgi:hypothetical protein